MLRKTNRRKFAGTSRRNGCSLFETLERRLQFALVLPAGSYAQASDYYRFTFGTAVTDAPTTGVGWEMTHLLGNSNEVSDFKVTIPSGAYSPALFKLVVLGTHVPTAEVDEFDALGHLRTSWVMTNAVLRSFSQTTSNGVLYDTVNVDMHSMDTTFNQINDAGEVISQVRTFYNFDTRAEIVPEIPDTFQMSTTPEPSETAEFGRGQMPLTSYNFVVSGTVVNSLDITTVAGLEGTALLGKLLSSDPQPGLPPDLINDMVYTKRDDLARPTLRWRFQNLTAYDYAFEDSTLDSEPRTETIRLLPEQAQVVSYDYDENGQMLAPVSEGYNFATRSSYNPSTITAFIEAPTSGLVNAPIDSLVIHFTEPVPDFSLSSLTFEGIDPATVTLTDNGDGGLSYTIGNLAEQQVDGGSYAVKLFALGSGITSLIGSTGKSWTVDSSAPQVLGATFDDNGTAPSPYRISLQLSEPVSTTAAGAPLLIRDADTGQIVQVASGFVQADGVTILADLPDTLPDGNYTADLPAGGAYDAAGNLNAQSFLLDFFILAGDANHDRTVNALDFNALASNFGLPNVDFTQGDFNHDGIVNTLDFGALAMNFGTSLAPPASAPLADATTSNIVAIPVASLFGATPAKHSDHPIDGLFA